MTYRSIMSAAVLVLGLIANRAIACDCTPTQSVGDELASSAAVFAGRVVTITAEKDHYGLQVKFNVTKVWKGVLKASVVVTTGVGTADCGYLFREGEDYLVYCYGAEGFLGTGICNRTGKLADAAGDLTLLGPGRSPDAASPVQSAPKAQPSAPASQPSAPASQPSAPASQPSAPASQPSAPVQPVPVPEDAHTTPDVTVPKPLPVTAPVTTTIPNAGPKEALPAPVAAHPNEPTPQPMSEGRLPLAIIAEGTLAASDHMATRPLLTVGRLPSVRDLRSPTFYQRPASYLFTKTPARIDSPDASSHPSTMLLEGLVNVETFLLCPSSTAQTVVLLLSPAIGSGEAWEPTELEQSGQTITLTVEEWTDNAPKRRNAMSRSAYLLSLGTLLPGDYLLRLKCRGMFKDLSAESTLYALQSVRSATLPFKVAPAGDSDAPALDESALKPEDLPVPERESMFQNSSALARRLVDSSREANSSSSVRMSVGSFDLKAWLAKDAAGSRQLPTLTEPAAGKSTYALIAGPRLDTTSGWMSLAKVQWHDLHATLHVEIWSDAAVRSRGSEISTPMLLTPLDLPGRWIAGKWSNVPGAYTVEVKWTWLSRQPSSGVYVKKEPPNGTLDKTQSQVEFRIP